MNTKYLKGTIPIASQEALDLLDAIANRLHVDLGFKPSRSEVVSYLARQWAKQHLTDYKPTADTLTIVQEHETKRAV